MSNLDNYINKVKEYIKNNPELSETEIIMYVYIDLAKRFKFNKEFFFGGSKKKEKIYRRSQMKDELESCMENNQVICKSASYILEYILKNVGVKIRTVIDHEDVRKHKHVYNVVTPKDGFEEYRIDLQEDMENIHYHAFTKGFGVSLYDDKKYIISRNHQKEIHEKIGYISKENPYVDEYIYLFKQDLGLFDDFYSKIDFVLQNIDPIEYPNVEYWERRWKHDKFLRELFSEEELDKKLNLVECYHEDEQENTTYFNCFFVNCKGGVKVYFYSKEDNKYNRYSLPEFAQKVKKEGIKYRQGILGLRTALNKLEDDVCQI